MSKLSEEEIIKDCENLIATLPILHVNGNVIQNLLDLYKNAKINNEIKENIINSLQNRLEELNQQTSKLNLENQALYESINCNDDNMLIIEYQKLKEKYEKTLKEYKERIADNLKYKDFVFYCIHKNKIKEILKQYENENFIPKEEIQKLLENQKQ